MSVTPASDWNDNQEDIYHYETIMNARKAPKTSARADAPTTCSKKPVYRICGLLSRQKEFEELGPPAPQSQCYGCWYTAEKEVAAVPYEEIVELIEMIRKTLPKTATINLAIHIAARYAKIRDEINRDLDPEEAPLPEWSAATILDHLQGNHNQDPELFDFFNLKRLKELACIAENASVIRNVETGEVKIDPVQAKMHLEYVKQIELLTKSDVSQKKYYSAGSHFEEKAASEGPISLSGRRMFSKWKNQ